MERSARGRELSFVLDLPAEVIPVQVDKDLLRIAMNNLLTNAIKYTDAGGTITVSVSESDDAVTICVAAALPNRESTATRRLAPARPAYLTWLDLRLSALGSPRG